MTEKRKNSKKKTLFCALCKRRRLTNEELASGQVNSHFPLFRLSNVKGSAAVKESWEQWITVNYPTVPIVKSMQICDLHFDPHWIISAPNMRSNLKDGAVPSHYIPPFERIKKTPLMLLTEKLRNADNGENNLTKRKSTEQEPQNQAKSPKVLCQQQSKVNEASPTSETPYAATVSSTHPAATGRCVETTASQEEVIIIESNVSAPIPRSTPNIFAEECFIFTRKVIAEKMNSYRTLHKANGGAFKNHPIQKYFTDEITVLERELDYWISKSKNDTEEVAPPGIKKRFEKVKLLYSLMIRNFLDLKSQADTVLKLKADAAKLKTVRDSSTQNVNEETNVEILHKCKVQEAQLISLNGRVKDLESNAKPLKLRVRSLQMSLYRQKRKLAALQALYQKDSIFSVPAMEKLETILSKPAMAFIKKVGMLASPKYQKLKGRPCSNEEREFSVFILKNSVKIYRYMRKSFGRVLPAVESVRNWVKADIIAKAQAIDTAIDQAIVVDDPVPDEEETFEIVQTGEHHYSIVHILNDNFD